MARKKAKALLSIVSVLMVCLLVSTSTTTVTASAVWGTLKAGDEMKWDDSILGIVTVKVLSVDGGLLKVERTSEGETKTYVAEDHAYTGINPYIVSKNDLEAGGMLARQQRYKFQDANYKAYAIQYSLGDDPGTYEIWYDFNTGILFERKYSGTNVPMHSSIKLVSTNADLAETGGICLGTLFIALVSVSTIVSYCLVRYGKKKRT